MSMAKLGKHSLLICLLLSTTLFCYSQDNVVKVGIKAGFGGATVTNSGLANLTYQDAIIAGLVMNCPISNILSFKGEALFSKKGYAQRLTFTDQNGNAYSTNTQLRSRFYYIEVPLLLQVRTSGDFVRLFANAGIAPSLNLGGSTKYKISGQAYTDPIPDIHKFDLGFIASLGVEYEIAQIPTFLEMRITDGLSYIYISSNARNLTYVLSTGIFF
jgi:hypothetical protein